MILGGTQRQAYTSGDRPVYGDVGHGPWCLGLPTPKQGAPIPYRPLKDGSPQDAGPGGGQ
jgi:phospholipid/cholesterol/gamma-HCH transport system substrate-binding protein